MNIKQLVTWCAVFGGILLPRNVNAEEGYGRIAGRVVDAESGQAIRDASIAILEDASFFVRTDLEGRYLFSDVPAGQYTVRVFKSGYDPLDVRGVSVVAGEVAQTDIPINARAERSADTPAAEAADGAGPVYELTAFQVSAEEIRDSEVGLLELRQRSIAISDAIGLDFFSRAGVSDAASAMSKIVGASVVDGKYVLIRGLGDRYSNTLLNGISIPSSDPDKRAVQLDQFPTELLESIVVSKTFTPDQPGAFSGGSVNLITRDFPVQAFFKVSLSVSYQANATGKEVLTIPGGGRDWLAMDDGTRRLPKDLPTNMVSSATAVRQAFNRGDTEFLEAFQRDNDAFDNRSYFPTTKKAKPGVGTDLAFGDQIILDGGRALGYSLNLTWDRETRHYENGESSRFSLGSSDPTQASFVEQPVIYSSLGNLSYTNSYRNNPNYVDANPSFGVTETTDEVSWGAFGQVSYKWSPSHQTSFRIFHTQNAEDTVTRGLGEAIRSDAGRIYERYNLLYTERAITSYQVSGKSYFSALSELSMDWRLSYSKSSMDEPDYRSFFSFWDIDQGGFASANGLNTRFFREIKDDSLEGSVDFRLPLQLFENRDSTVRFGGLWSEGGRSYAENKFAYANIIRSAEQRQNFPNPVGIVSQTDTAITVGNFLRRVGSPAGYDADQQMRAGYLMLEQEITSKLRAVAGVRVEQTMLSSIPDQGRAADIDQVDYLPAVSLVYELNPKMNLRLAFGKTIARPIYKELTDVRLEDAFLDIYYVGNPELEMSRALNYDLRWEWYPGAGEIVAVSLFYKDLPAAIELLFRPELGAFQPGNATGSIKVYGIEFEYRRSLERLLTALENFSVGANLAFIGSEAEIDPDELIYIRTIIPDAKGTRSMADQSPYTFNLDLTYDNDAWGTQVSLLFNIVGSSIYAVNYGPLPNVYERQYPLLDLTYSQKLGENWSFKVSAKNLLDSEKQKSIRNAGYEYFAERYNPGRSFSVSFSYSFN